MADCLPHLKSASRIAKLNGNIAARFVKFVYGLRHTYAQIFVRQSFGSRSPMQRDAIMRVSLLTAKFQSTRSHGTVRLPSFSTPRASIHAPHGVRRASGCQSALGAFQSTHPVWGATILQSYMCHNTILFQSTHPHGAPHCAKSRIYKLACPLAPAQGLSARAPCG